MSIGAAHPKYLWWNGEMMPWEQGTVHVTQMHWTAVSAIFEGIMAYWNEDEEELFVFQLDGHLKRFIRSQKMMRMRADYTVQQLTDAITGLLRANESRTDTYVFPYAYPQGGGRFRSFNASEPGPAEVQVTTRPSASHLLKRDLKHACVSSWTRIPDNVMPPRIKNIANYRNGSLASSEAAINGYDAAILLNTAGKVAEGPGACIMMVRDGKLVTPTGTDSILESITRAAIMTLARDWASRSSSAPSTAPSSTSPRKSSFAARRRRSRRSSRWTATSSAMATRGRSRPNWSRASTTSCAARTTATPTGSPRSAHRRRFRQTNECRVPGHPPQRVGG